MPGGKSTVSQPPLSQKLVAAIGAVLVAATLVYLGQAALSDNDSPPDVSLSVKEIRQNGSDFLVTFIASNSGSRTAAAVHAEAQLSRDGRVVELSRATLDYVPGKSEKEGGFWFQVDPSQGELMLRVEGYQVP